MSHNIQDLGIDGQLLIAQQENQILYLNTIDPKRPNIISRSTTNTTPLQRIQYVEMGGSDAIVTLPFSQSDLVSCIDVGNSGVDQGQVCYIQDSTVVGNGWEQFLTSNRSDSIYVEAEELPSGELALSLEPTIIAAAAAKVPTSLQLQQIVHPDSTKVSQSLTTPIVTHRIVTSPCLSNEQYPSTNVQQDNQLFIQPLQPEIIQNDNYIKVEDGAIILAPTTSVVQNDQQISHTQPISVSAGDGTQVQQENTQADESSYPMRIEVGEDGSCVLYMDSTGGEQVEIGKDAQVIQTETFPVIPNRPIELPNATNGGTESFILVPVDANGSTVLVPTAAFSSRNNNYLRKKIKSNKSSIKSEKECTATSILPKKDNVSHGKSSDLKRSQPSPSSTTSTEIPSKVLKPVGLEKPNPFRYSFPVPEDDEEHELWRKHGIGNEIRFGGESSERDISCILPQLINSSINKTYENNTPCSSDNEDLTAVTTTDPSDTSSQQNIVEVTSGDDLSLEANTENYTCKKIGKESTFNNFKQSHKIKADS